MRIGIIAGSISKDSINRRVGLALAPVFEARGAEVTQIPITDLPLFNRDDESPMPPAVAAYHDAIAAQDAILFVTPGYSRSMPSAMKNATEWGTRPTPYAVLPGKPAAVTGATPSRTLTVAAQQHLRANLTAIGMPISPAELYIAFEDAHFPADATIADEQTAKSITNWADKVMAHFTALIG